MLFRSSSERLGWQAQESVLASGLIPQELARRYEEVSGELLEAVEAVFESAGEVAAIRIHGDCHLGNLLWNERGPVFVDLDDCMMGPRVQDLWMLLSGDRDAMQGQLSHVLNGYRAFMDFNVSELALIEPLRALRMIHHSAWIADRWDDPAFPAAFPWFGTPAYWDQQTTQLREQLEHMTLEPLRAF